MKKIFFEGEVIKGKALGRTLGFPTLNMNYNGELKGVFLGRAEIFYKTYNGVLNIADILEIHLFDFSQQISPKEKIKIYIGEKIRETRKFKTLDDLSSQIAKDVLFAKNWYNSHAN
ncbi:MAG: riboflavin kinase [Candidatus Gracilibacteria bacterium]|jgi:riboflavin kinase/FMN adenylyltransferase